MNAKSANSTTGFVDPDEAPEWTDEEFAMAEVSVGDQVIKPATGAMTRGRGRPRSENPKQHITLRIDRGVVEAYRASGPEWRARMEEVLKKAIAGS